MNIYFLDIIMIKKFYCFLFSIFFVTNLFNINNSHFNKTIFDERLKNFNDYCNNPEIFKFNDQIEIVNDFNSYCNESDTGD
jgi:hypothetical protein